jgi:putative NIF3 family GTP cyclohydrolase 1 type 2
MTGREERMMNANELREHFLSRAPWVNCDKTVDTVKVGDPTRAVRTVGVGWAGAIENLRTAVERGCELYITHEPLFWNHWDPPDDPLRGIEPGRTKAKLLADSGLVVLRVHDAWDRWPGIGIRDSWASWLGLTELVHEDKARWHAMFAIDPQPLRAFAAHVARRIAPLGEDSVQVIGNPEQIVRRPAVGFGCSVPDQEMIDAGADVLFCCFDGASYWARRQRFAELGLAVLTVEHGTSEMPGMMNLAKYLPEQFDGLTAHYLDRHARTWTVKSAAT